ncbi:hypothetical protein FHX37_4039 [Haloactinospora alba]|uniref:Helix-turn-helix protein n=1 Tax=Haloactinospora alba TaxID=405555 RepID=A0A543NA34_9ACTN|nr:helix-turn-helix transcriptional regulator [Haloactinospora alba]TQN28679.1 hypothetical protein FHX37_4039 [Haloactinospora alba]
MAGKAFEPITIPSWAWKREETRRILRDRDMAGLLRFAQKYGGASQTKLATVTGIAQGRVSEIMNGHKNMTAFGVIERVADGLDMPDPERMLLGLAPQNPEIRTGENASTPTDMSTPVQPSVEIFAEEDRVRRRDFVGLAGSAAVQAATRPPTGIDAIARTLTRYTCASSTSSPHTTERIDLRSLVTAVHTAKSDYQACRHSNVVARLPELLGRLEAAVSNYDGDSLMRVRALQAEAYHTAASVLLKSEERGLAWLAADRSMRMAERSASLATIGASARVIIRALTKDRCYRTATELATTTAERVEQETDNPSSGSLSVYGALLLSGSIAAAQHEDRRQAYALLDEAETVGRRLGGDHNHHWTAFGPTNVLLHRVNAAVTLGDAGSAIDYARRIHPDTIDVMERKVTLFVDAARAYSQWGKLDKAYESLAAAEQFASEELSVRPDVHDLINDIGTRASGHLSSNITGLAHRAGLN